MKKVLGALILSLLFLVGCNARTTQNDSNDMKKQSKIEIYTVQDEKLLKTIDNQDTINQLFNLTDWENVNNLPENLIPEYKLLIYQEETLLLGQNPEDERDYELIETIITYQDSPYIESTISENAIKGKRIPEDFMTFYYIMPDDVMESLNGQIVL